MNNHIRHALVQRSVGFYSIFLPPDYETDTTGRTYPVCILLHGMGGSDMDYDSSILDILGHEGVIYVAPRAPHPSGESGWRAWPMPWSDWQKEGFPRDDVQAAGVPGLYTEWIARCLADARERYRISDQKVTVFGHSEGATFAHRFAYDYPHLVTAYFAHAGSYDYAIEGSSEIFSQNNIFPLIAHCKDDPSQKFEGAQMLIDHFQEKGLPHETLFLEEGGHGLMPPFLKRAQEFLATWCRER